jgi:hypothetical protein
MIDKRFIHKALVTAKWICVAVLLMPGFAGRKTGDGEQWSVQLGWPSAPWVRYEKASTETKTPQPDGSTTTTHNTQSNLMLSPLSWSLLIGVFGAAAFHFAALRYRPDSADAQQPDSPSPESV